MSQNVGFENMIEMDNFSLEKILENCRQRFEKNLIYSNVGDILVAINPYEAIPELFSREKVREISYSEGHRPHIFSVAKSALDNLKRHGSQSILISGESGAGKTESMKLILQYFSQNYQLAESASHLVDESQKNEISELLLEANPILESFGNAKTVRNFNSSRFGKFLEISFSSHLKVPEMQGGKITPYLLEKSRVVSQSKNERNFHIFYQFLSSIESFDDEERKLWHVSERDNFKYLANGLMKLPGIDDSEECDNLRNSLDSFEFTEEDQKAIFSVISAILHTGNIQFKESKKTQDAAEILNPELIPLVSKILSVNEKAFADVLLIRTISVNNQVTKINLKLDQAVDNRDALSKTLYERLFQFLVTFMNQVLELKNKKKKTQEQPEFIGVLDIFGFENFETNSLEQLLINFTNEKLKTFSMLHIFKLEQELYKSEKIEWADVKFHDDLDCLNLIESKMGIFSILDEQCKFPTSTDSTFLEKMNSTFKQNPAYIPPKLSKTTFAIAHYAGAVTYTVTDFLEKNKNTLLQDVVTLFQSSQNQLVAALFEEYDSFESSITGTLRTTSSPSPSRPEPKPKPPSLKTAALSISKNGSTTEISKKGGSFLGTESGSKRKGSFLGPESPKQSGSFLGADSGPRKNSSVLGGTIRTKNNSTVSSFKRELDTLINTLGGTQTHFVRCVKPNDDIKPKFYDDSVVFKQLKYLNMEETVKVRKLGFPIRYSHADFFHEFYILGEKLSSHKDRFQILCQQLKQAFSFQVGTTRVFMKTEEHERMAQLKVSRLEKKVVVLQSFFRGVHLKRYYSQLKQKTIILQAVARQRQQRTEFQKILKSTILLQGVARIIKARNTFRNLKQEAKKKQEEKERLERIEQEKIMKEKKEEMLRKKEEQRKLKEQEQKIKEEQERKNRLKQEKDLREKLLKEEASRKKQPVVDLTKDISSTTVIPEPEIPQEPKPKGRRKDLNIKLTDKDKQVLAEENQNTSMKEFRESQMIGKGKFSKEKHISLRPNSIRVTQNLKTRDSIRGTVKDPKKSSSGSSNKVPVSKSRYPVLEKSKIFSDLIATLQQQFTPIYIPLMDVKAENRGLKEIVNETEAPLYPFIAFVTQYFTPQTTGTFKKKKLKPDELMSYSKEKLTNPLTKMAQRPTLVALQTWTAMQHYLGIALTLSDEERYQVVRALTFTGLEVPSVRDEMYCQILKLLTKK